MHYYVQTAADCCRFFTMNIIYIYDIQLLNYTNNNNLGTYVVALAIFLNCRYVIYFFRADTTHCNY